MWIFTKDGFFSTTLNERPSEPGTLMVRARVEDDLKRLITTLGTKTDTGQLGLKIIETPRADYRYRIILPRWAWTVYLTIASDGIDYTNVKDTLAPMKTEGPRHTAMMKVWSAMYALQPGGRRWGSLIHPTDDDWSWDEVDDDDEWWDCPDCGDFHDPEKHCPTL